MSIPINRKAWSCASQRSCGHYDECATEYEGIRCHCIRCDHSFVLAAEEQQFAYEVQKKYIWWLPNLCVECAVKLDELRSKDREYQFRWNASREILKTDHKFISDWYEVLQQMTHFRKFNSMRVHLQRLLEEDTT
jgi:hypothetical protein